MYQMISSEFAEYKIGDFINNGQFSTVKRAIELRSGNAFAAKIVDKRSLTKLQIERLYTEIHILKQISHPNIIRLLDIIHTEQHVYLITDLMGKDLFEYLRMVGRVEEERCKIIIGQVLEAISYLHENNIVHRDIKPENILLMLGNDNKICLADFGFAKYSNPDEEIQTPCGTLQYIAPEIANNETYKQSIDLWGVGVTLYLLLSGQPPFFSSDTNKLREKVLKGRVTFSPKRWSDISEEAKDFIKMLLSKDPSKRPTAREALKHKWINKSYSTHQQSLSNFSSNLTSSSPHLSTTPTNLSFSSSSPLNNPITTSSSFSSSPHNHNILSQHQSHNQNNTLQQKHHTNKSLTHPHSPSHNNNSVVHRSQPQSIPSSSHFVDMDLADDTFSSPLSSNRNLIDVFSPENTPPQIGQGKSGLLVKKVLDITFSFQQPEDFQYGAFDDSDNQFELGSVNNSDLFKKRTKK